MVVSLNSRCLKLEDAVRIGELDASECSVVSMTNGKYYSGLVLARGIAIHVRCIRLIAISSSYNTAIDTGCVAMPSFQRNLARSLTGVDIDQTDIQLSLNARLSFPHILS